MASDSHSSSRLIVAHSGNAAHLTLKNPPVNVIDTAMMEELLSAIREVEQRPEINAIVFRGDGKCFSAGVDIAAHIPERIQEMLSKFHAVILAIARSPKISVAMVHGNCLGGGAELAMVCDMVYTASDATWGFPEIKLACYPPVACTVLASLVGQKRATELIVSGDTFTGTDAAKIGLATVSGSQKEMEQKLTELLVKLGKLSAAALGVTKKAIYT